MLKLKIPISKICQELHVSRPLIYKAIAKYGINYDRYTALNPDELLVAIREIKQNHPNAGEVMVQGHLEAKGIHVQHEQIRNAIYITLISLFQRESGHQ